MSYGSVAEVEAIVPALGAFSASSTPTSAQISAWLEEAYAQINSQLAAAGYAVPVTATGALPLLRALENLYGAAYALRARGLEVAHDESERQSETYLKDFHKRLDLLVKTDLSVLGVGVRPTAPSTRRRRLRSLQMRRVDGYSGAFGDATVTYDQESD